MSGSDPSELPKYRYQPLRKPKSLRLLELRPGSATADDIDCELIEVLPQDIQSRPYEAVSWTWGTEQWTKSIRIHRKKQAYSFIISPNLHSGLKALRYEGKVRTLWIDAICIDQRNADEKNHQVPMMAQIYGQATRACVWLGEASADSKMALDFIKENVLKLWEFDRLCENPKASPGWAALIGLMKRPWFSRRWVVQEIALANEGILYCGEETISWQDFADAVSLFVEVETATHRLSEVMKKDQAFNHIPDFFGYVPAFGATLLVEATSNLFRRSKEGVREPLLSLEYLVSSLSVFDALQPRDTIYALLAIAKDTLPRAASERQADYSIAGQQMSAWSSNILSKPYHVDYEQPFIEVCRDFIMFSIRQSEQTRALDIICRPWAPKIKKEDERDVMGKQPNGSIKDGLEKLPSWIPSLEGAAFGMYEITTGHKMGRMNADPLVGLPVFGQRNYSAAGTRAVKRSALKFKIRRKYCSMYAEGFILDNIGEIQEIARNGNIPTTWLKFGGWENTKEDPPQEFWRTVVANRGPNGRNAPTFYPRASTESIKKGMHGGSLDATVLIEHGRCSIVAEFLRRVQAVIWNKRLMRTEPHSSGELGKPDEPGRLGLVPENAMQGDLICILYGCSVPVVLRQFEKSDAQLAREQVEDKAAMRVEAALTIQRGWRGVKRRRVERERNIDAQRRQKEAEARSSEDEKRRVKKEQRRSVEKPSRSSLFNTCSEFARDKANHYRDQGSLASMRFRRRAFRFTKRYQQAAGYIIPVYFGVYIKFHEDANLALAILTVTVSLPIIFAMFPWTLSPLLWIWSMIVRILKTRGRRQEPANRYYYKLIGDCYLHGMMDSEAISYQNEKGIKPQTFEMR